MQRPGGALTLSPRPAKTPGRREERVARPPGLATRAGMAGRNLDGWPRADSDSTHVRQGCACPESVARSVRALDAVLSRVGSGRIEWHECNTVVPFEHTSEACGRRDVDRSDQLREDGRGVRRSPPVARFVAESMRRNRGVSSSRRQELVVRSRRQDLERGKQARQDDRRLQRAGADRVAACNLTGVSNAVGRG
jgi:hypothetical protein